jgi:hypothetical protein
MASATKLAQMDAVALGKLPMTREFLGKRKKSRAAFRSGDVWRS